MGGKIREKNESICILKAHVIDELCPHCSYGKQLNDQIARQNGVINSVITTANTTYSASPPPFPFTKPCVLPFFPFIGTQLSSWTVTRE